MPRWIELDELANLRDVGGVPTLDGGEIAPGRLLRSDNLQTLTDADVDALLALGVTDVVDLRSDYEREAEGPGPLTKTEVVHHPHSFFREWREGVGEDKDGDAAEAVEERPEAVPDEALPWVDLEPSVSLQNETAGVYLSYVVDRPDSVLAGLREIADAEGATLVHCAAGKDRTGTLVALALLLVGADREAVIDDYAASSERAQRILDRLLASDTYAENLRGRPLSSHLSRPETMRAFLEHVDATYGGVEPMLQQLGWTADDTARLRAKLRDPAEQK
ncbi:tyrosine-protein phosphatase [Microlunatus spumicola]|uniref:Tyrosine-protein phosphatase n=1 Tax=Microlunatus spumicola TaxID=81499 RepID=A0ABP6XIK0_9ACTN